MSPPKNSDNKENEEPPIITFRNVVVDLEYSEDSDSCNDQGHRVKPPTGASVSHKPKTPASA